MSVPNSVEDYWERLERHDWFYPWAEGQGEYEGLVKETKRLWQTAHTSSRAHTQLYATYHTLMYSGLSMSDDDGVENIVIPQTKKPEAA